MIPCVRSRTVEALRQERGAAGSGGGGHGASSHVSDDRGAVRDTIRSAAAAAPVEAEVRGRVGRVRAFLPLPSEAIHASQVARAEVSRMLRAARREEAAARSGGGAPDDALMAYIEALERARDRVG